MEIDIEKEQNRTILILQQSDSASQNSETRRKSYNTRIIILYAHIGWCTDLPYSSPRWMSLCLYVFVFAPPSSSSEFEQERSCVNTAAGLAP